MGTLKKQVLTLLEDLEAEDFKTFKWHLQQEERADRFTSIPRSRLENADRLDTVDIMDDVYSSQMLRVTEKVFRTMNKNGTVQTLQRRRPEPEPHDVLSDGRSELKKRLMNVRITRVGSRPLKDIYTELHILTQETGQVNREHEIVAPGHTPTFENVPKVTCDQIFSAAAGRVAPLRVLTKGVAGIGKTVVTQKFILDWAEGRANQDLHFLFPVQFQELNLVDSEKKFSLVDLIEHFFPEVRAGEFRTFEHLNVAFIFDGFDESRNRLDFQNTPILTDITKCSGLEVVLVNLIRGELLPNARIWVTSRPAAASQIPTECFHMVTEIQGFTDEQKEEYLTKVLKDEEQSVRNQVISHIKNTRTLYIMCHIPMFVWIAALVLTQILKNTQSKDLPKTLTELYIYFLIDLTKRKNLKYDRKSVRAEHWSFENKKMVLALAKLALEQFQFGNLTFSEMELKERGIDIKAAATYSGVLTEIFQEERYVNQDKVFCFIHLSVQEFLAALHVHSTFVNTGVNALKATKFRLLTLFRPSLTKLHQAEVDRVLLSPHGNWDLFLRFLMGLSQPSNQHLLQGLLKETQFNTTDTVNYIQRKLDQNLPVEQSLNLFHCLAELNDSTLERRIQDAVQSGPLSAQNLTPSEWSALTFFLLSKPHLKDFDLKKYSATEMALRRLLPVIKASNKALLNLCNLSKSVCAELGSLLSSDSCQLIELDLSDNDLKDSGIQTLLSALRRPNRTLQVLRLHGCLLTEEGCSSLAAALESKLLNVRELDLRYNHPGDRGVSLLSALQENADCSLSRFRADEGGEKWLRPGLDKYSCKLKWNTESLPKGFQMSEDQTELRVVDGKIDCRMEVRCTDVLTERCYWEAECHGAVEVKVTRGLRRQGSRPKRSRSWSVTYNNNSFMKKKNGRQIGRKITFPKMKKVGVFLDRPGGVLVFYIMDTQGELTPTYIVECNISDPLYAAFGFLSPDAIVRLCSPGSEEQSAEIFV